MKRWWATSILMLGVILPTLVAAQNRTIATFDPSQGQSATGQGWQEKTWSTAQQRAPQTTQSLPSQQTATIKTIQGAQPCWDEAARYHGLDPWLLYAIAYTESHHNPNAISPPNRNGTYDIGLMQINSAWLPTLRQYGITQTTLKNACASTYVGAWVMAKNIRQYGYSWQAIAAYNVGSLDTPKRRQIGYAYAKKVYTAYDILTKRRPSVALADRPSSP